MRAGGVVGQRTWVRIVGHAADRFRGEPGVGGIREVARDQSLEMRHTRRIPDWNAGPAKPPTGGADNETSAEAETRDGRLGPPAAGAGLAPPDAHPLPSM